MKTHSELCTLLLIFKLYFYILRYIRIYYFTRLFVHVTYGMFLYICKDSFVNECGMICRSRIVTPLVVLCTSSLASREKSVLVASKRSAARTPGTRIACSQTPYYILNFVSN